MFIITPQPTFYRPAHCHSRARRAFGRHAYSYWHPFEVKEPSITWIVHQPVDPKITATGAVPASQPEPKPGATDDATVVHRNTASENNNENEPSNVVPHNTTSDNNGETPFVVKVKLPRGISAHDLRVRVQNHVLFIAGEQRLVYGNLARTTSFARQFPVDSNVDTDKISAVIDNNGVLVVTAPQKPKDLPILSDSTKEESKVTFSDTTTSTSTEVEQPNPKPTAVEPKPDTKPTAIEPKPVTTEVTQPPVLVPFKLQVSQNDDKVFAVTVQLPPGVTANDLDLQVTKGVLSISGEQRKEYNGSVLTSKFVRHFTLDKSAEVDKIQATLDDQTRTLTVTVPKKPAEKPAVQKIAIQVGGTTWLPDEERKDESVDPESVPNEDEEKQPTGHAPLGDNKVDETSIESKDESWTAVEKASDETEIAAAHEKNL